MINQAIGSYIELLNTEIPFVCVFMAFQLGGIFNLYDMAMEYLLMIMLKIKKQNKKNKL